jgi:hypothetical protein
MFFPGKYPFFKEESSPLKKGFAALHRNFPFQTIKTIVKNVNKVYIKYSSEACIQKVTPKSEP